jgi:hypothetical protein
MDDSSPHGPADPFPAAPPDPFGSAPPPQPPPAPWEAPATAPPAAPPTGSFDPAYGQSPYVAQAPPAQQPAGGAPDPMDRAYEANPYVAQAPVAAQPKPGDRYHLRISKVTSVLRFTTRRFTTYTGTYEQLEAAYKKVRVYNLLCGWWGVPFGVIWTPMALARNAAALKKLKALAGR